MTTFAAPAADSVESVAGRADGGAGATVRNVYRAERRKLAAQLSTRASALSCLLGPVAFAAVLRLQGGVPADTLFGIWVHTSGFAVSLVVLGFAGAWGFPVLAGVLAGDLFSAEDRYGTWKMVLTRSCSRRDLFAGKLLATAMVAVALLAVTALSSLIAGLALTGAHRLVGLDGTELSAWRVLGLVVAAWLVSVLPLLAFVGLAALFSIATRSGIAGVLGPLLVALAMQLLALVGSGAWVHMLLLGAAFDDWHGLLAGRPFYGPLLLESLVSLGWLAATLAAGWLLLRRRDFAGPRVTRRAGWVGPARVVIGAVAMLAVLAAATGLGPSTVTATRLQASITPTFDRLTLLQQRLLGRPVAPGASLRVLTTCRRRAGGGQGPGDDWVCTLDVFTPQAGPEPFQQTPVTYDLSVKSNGCYKAEAPPSFIGQQLMRDAGGAEVVNPLFTIYGCFDTT